MNTGRLNELEAKETNKNITKLEAEELELLKKLQKNLDRQVAEQARIQQEALDISQGVSPEEAKKTREVAEKEYEAQTKKDEEAKAKKEEQDRVSKETAANK